MNINVDIIFFLNLIIPKIFTWFNYRIVISSEVCGKSFIVEKKKINNNNQLIVLTFLDIQRFSMHLDIYVYLDTK